MCACGSNLKEKNFHYHGKKTKGNQKAQDDQKEGGEAQEAPLVFLF